MKTFLEFINEFIKYEDQYTGEDRDAIHNYQSWSRTLNSAIATGTEDAIDLLQIKKLDALIKVSKNKTKNGQIVYRGVSKNRITEFRKIIGQTYIHKPFLSTSTDYQAARDFTRSDDYVIEIKLKANNPFLYITHDMEYFNEKEVLLPRNLKFQVLEKNGKLFFYQK
jgi:hypothetical protein